MVLTRPLQNPWQQQNTRWVSCNDERNGTLQLCARAAMALWNLYFCFWMQPSKHILCPTESPCEMWDAFVEEVVAVCLAMEGSICSTFVYPVITGLSTLCDYTVVLAGERAVTPPRHPPLLLLHLHRHGNSSHRGELAHRKLGVWQDKTLCSSDTVPWQPVRAAENDKKNKTCRYECSSVLLHSPADCKRLRQTEQPAHLLSYSSYTSNTIYLSSCLQCRLCGWRAAISLSFFKTLTRRCVAVGLSHAVLYGFSHQYVLIKCY